jgi:hypothetical protein
MIAAVAGISRMAVTWMARVTVAGMARVAVTWMAVREAIVRGSAVGARQRRQAERED